MRGDPGRVVADEINDLSREERLKVWVQKTGKSESALYRRLAELEGVSAGEK